MIFVTLGTQDMSFNRLLEAVESFVIEHEIKEEIIVQAGHTNYHSKYMKIHPYFTSSEFESLINKASLIISHGGAGSLFNAMHHHKKIIAMARLKRFGEHNDDHQTELVNELASKGYLLKIDSSFEEVKNLIDTFVPKPYETKNQIQQIITNFMEEH